MPDCGKIEYLIIFGETITFSYTVHYQILPEENPVIEYDPLGDGTWTTDNTYVYTSAGLYKPRLKVSDSLGKHNIRSKDLFIADIPFEEKTLAQKLEAHIVNPADLAAALEHLKNEKNTSHQKGDAVGYDIGYSEGNNSGYTTGYYDGNDSGYGLGRSEAIEDYKTYPEGCGIKPKAIIVPML